MNDYNTRSSADSIKVVVAETAVIIRSGVVAALKRLPHISVQPIEVTTREALISCVKMQHPQLAIIDPTFGGWLDITSFMAQTQPHTPATIALQCGIADPAALSAYDATITMRDDTETIAKTINRLLAARKESATQSQEENTLSTREKEVLACIVRGLTNKEIAQKLFISIHTVITHRRNVSRKLQIHSSVGLTIYAIVNKLVALDEIQDPE